MPELQSTVAGGAGMNRYGSRKFVIALLGLIGAHAALWGGLIDAGTYKVVVLGAIGLYAGGNVWQKAIEAKQP